MKKKGSFLGMVPLIAFLLIYIGIGVYSGDFNKMPLLVGILIASGIAIFLVGMKKDKDTTFESTIDDYCEGAADKTLLLMVFIFILAGAFYSVANSMHAVDTVVSLGLNILPVNLVLPGLFMIGCLLSFSMGTSMGTIAALMPIGASIATKTGINPSLIAGIVVGGAMFGDNLSFISDTTIAATRTQEIEMKDKFISNFLIVLPAVIINLILLLLQPVNIENMEKATNINLVNLIPYVLIIVLSLIGMNVVKVMSLGILSGIIIGVMHGDFTIIGSLEVIHTGMKWMEDGSIIAIAVGGLVALMAKLGGIDWLLNTLSKNTKSARGGELSIALLVSLLDIATTNNTISIIAAGPIAKDISDEFGIDRRRTASILDVFSSAFNGLLPYGGQLIVAASLTQITPISIMRYNYYSMLMIVFGLLSIFLGYPKFKKRGDK